MASIQTSPHPLVFPLGIPTDVPPALPPIQSDSINLRTFTRSLEGMQKEAVVCGADGTTAWRMVCDEGPYLNGTDLAPFPLGFFCAGMISCFMSELVRLLRQHRISYDTLKLVQDNRYSMEGSALKGTMTGGALPVELQLVIDSPALPARLQQLLLEAVAASPAGALLDGIHTSAFSLTHNGRNIGTARVETSGQCIPTQRVNFDTLAPAQTDCARDLIVKNRAAEVVHGISGGVGSSMAENQKRILHMQGVCTLHKDGLKEINVNLFQPLGSQFRFYSDDGDSDLAPSGLALLSAGLAFCFMTQIGRYAGIRKLPLTAYSVVQDTAFATTGKVGGMEPVTTHVFIDSTHDDEYARQVIDMSEQTCFLHAACRNKVAVKLKNIQYAIPVVP